MHTNRYPKLLLFFVPEVRESQPMESPAQEMNTGWVKPKVGLHWVGSNIFHFPIFATQN